MTLHAWAEHVVHVQLASRDAEIARTAARFFEQRFWAQDVEVRPSRARHGCTANRRAD